MSSILRRQSLIVILCTISLLACYFVVPPAAAADDVTITVGTVPAAAEGAVVTIPITANEVGDIVSFGFTIDYDRSKLEFVDWDKTDTILESVWDLLVTSNDADNVNIQLRKPAVAYLNISNKSIFEVLGASGSGILAQIKFKVLAGGANSTIPVTFSEALNEETTVSNVDGSKTVTKVAGGLLATDTTPPEFAAGYPKAGNPQANGSRQVRLLIDVLEDVEYYYVVLPDGAGDINPPTANQIIEENYVGAILYENGSVTVREGVDLDTGSILPDHNTPYDFWIVITDDADNASVPVKLDLTTPIAADFFVTGYPTQGEEQEPGSDKIEILVKTQNTTGNDTVLAIVHYVAVPAGEGAPTIDQIGAGKDSTGNEALLKGYIDIPKDTTGATQILLTLPEADTDYDIYLVAGDAKWAFPSLGECSEKVMLEVTTPRAIGTDASVTGITVKGVVATADAGNPTTYNVVLPVGTDLAELGAEDIVVTSTDSNAVVGTAVTTDGGATWTVEVTAEDGTTKETYTINVTVAAVYAFDVLVDSDVTKVYSIWEESHAYPVCNGLLVYVEEGDTTQAVEISFTPGANDGGVYNVTLDVAFPGNDGSYLEFLFSELPTVLSEISLISGDAFTLDEVYSDQYNSESTGEGVTYYSLYQGFEFEGLEPGGQLNATFTATLPRSDGEPVERTINLTVRHNPDRFPDAAADFSKLLGTRDDLADYYDPVEIWQGVMFSDDNDWLTSEQVLSGTVNDYRAFAVKADSYVDVALAFETSEYEKFISWDLYDSTGELYDDDDYYEIDNELMDESESEVKGYRSDRTDGINTTSEAGPWLLVATNIRGDYLPIVLSLTDVSDEEELVLPEWQDAWDEIIAEYEAVYTVTIAGGGSGASGAGGYAAGDTVNITAGSRSGYTFKGWTSDDVTITNASSKNASFTMPAKNVTVTATWKRASSGGGGGGVVTPAVTGVKIKAVPDKVSYTEGDELDLTGLQVTLTYSNGTTKDIALADFADYKITVSPKDGDVLDADDKEIVITVNGKTVKQAITVEEDSTVTPPVEEPVLTDIAGHWAKANIEYLVGIGAVAGYPDETFRPDSLITRAEFAKIIVDAFELTAESGKIFADTADHWAKDYIAIAAANGIVLGYNDNEFGPDDLITREQMAIMIVKAAGLKDAAGELTFSDKEDVSPWAYNWVVSATQNKIMSGYTDNTFKPLKNATRAEAATVIYNVLMK